MVMGGSPTLRHENGLSSSRATRSDNVARLGSVEAAHKLTWERPAPALVPLSPPSKDVTRMLLPARDALATWRCVMERVSERCGGLDVHKKTVTAGVRGARRERAREPQVRKAVRGLA